MALRGEANKANTATNSAVVVNVVTIGIQSGDIVLLCVVGGGGTTNTFTYPSGFGAITGLANQAMAGQSTQGIAYKVAGGSEPGSYSVSSSATDFLTLECRVYSGRNTVSPFTATAVTSTVFGSTSPFAYVLTGLTAGATDDVVIFMANTGYDGATSASYTAPSGYAHARTVFATTQFSPIISTCDNENVAGGATGTGGGTYTVGTNTTDYCGMQLSIAAGGAPPPAGVSNPMFHRQNKLYFI